jgi:hypothetical protein
MAKSLRPDVPEQMGDGIGMAIDVTLKGRHAATGTLGTAVYRLVKLLLGEGGDQKPQALHLLRVEDPIEELVEIGSRHGLALGHIPQVGPRGQKHGGGNLGRT